MINTCRYIIYHTNTTTASLRLLAIVTNGCMIIAHPGNPFPLRKRKKALWASPRPFANARLAPDPCGERCRCPRAQAWSPFLPSVLSGMYLYSSYSSSIFRFLFLRGVSPSFPTVAPRLAPTLTPAGVNRPRRVVLLNAVPPAPKKDLLTLFLVQTLSFALFLLWQATLLSKKQVNNNARAEQPDRQ